MRKNFPCFIPTMVVVVAIVLSAMTTTVYALSQVSTESIEEEAVADTSEDHERVEDETTIPETSSIVVEITEIETEPVEIIETTKAPETTKVIETTAATTVETIPEPEPENVYIYYDVPLSHALQDHIFAQCEARGIDPKIIIAMIKVESNYNSDNVGDSGRSLGLMQIQPRWHSWRLAELGCSDFMNPFDNVTVGIDILADLYDSSGSMDWALMAYNGGSAYANRKSAAGIVTSYVEKVMAIRGDLYAYESNLD